MIYLECQRCGGIFAEMTHKPQPGEMVDSNHFIQKHYNPLNGGDLSGGAFFAKSDEMKCDNCGKGFISGSCLELSLIKEK
jgi:hypothetical protein